jgi:N-acetylglucosamine transport system permease protein
LDTKSVNPKTPKSKDLKKKSMIGKNPKEKSRNIFIFLCVAPTFLLFKIYPMIDAARMSLYRSSGLTSSPKFIVFENFQILINDPIFWKALGNTFFLLCIFPLVTMLLALFLAVLLTKGRMFEWEKTLYRLVYFLPNILSMVIIVMIFMYIYDFNLGILCGNVYSRYK